MVGGRCLSNDGPGSGVSGDCIAVAGREEEKTKRDVRREGERERERERELSSHTSRLEAKDRPTAPSRQCSKVTVDGEKSSSIALLLESGGERDKEETAFISAMASKRTSSSLSNVPKRRQMRKPKPESQFVRSSGVGGGRRTWAVASLTAGD